MVDLVDGLEAHLEVRQTGPLVFPLHFAQTGHMFRVVPSQLAALRAKLAAQVDQISGEHAEHRQLRRSQTGLGIVVEALTGLVEVLALALEVCLARRKSIWVLEDGEEAHRAEFQLSQVARVGLLLDFVDSQAIKEMWWIIQGHGDDDCGV